MALKGGSIKALPNRASLGVIKSVGQAKLSEKGIFYVICLDIAGQQGGLDQKFYYLFRPEWFARAFDPEVDLDPDNFEPLVSTENKVFDGNKLFGMYRQYVNDTTPKKASHLENMLGGKAALAKLGEAIDALATDPDERGIEQLLREALTGQTVGYVSKQKKDENGNLQDGFQISYFFPATEEGIESITKYANSGRAKQPLVITWSE